MCGAGYAAGIGWAHYLGRKARREREGLEVKRLLSERRAEMVITETHLSSGEVRYRGHLLVDGEVRYERHYDLYPGQTLASLSNVARTLGLKVVDSTFVAGETN